MHKLVDAMSAQLPTRFAPLEGGRMNIGRGPIGQAIPQFNMPPKGDMPVTQAAGHLMGEGGPIPVAFRPPFFKTKGEGGATNTMLSDGTRVGNGQTTAKLMNPVAVPPLRMQTMSRSNDYPGQKLHDSQAESRMPQQANHKFSKADRSISTASSEASSETDDDAYINQNQPAVDCEDDVSPRGASALAKGAFSLSGRCTIFDRLVVLNKVGDLGAWNGHTWKEKRTSALRIYRIAHDVEGQLWSFNNRCELSRLTRTGWKNMGKLGRQDLIDFAFDADRKLWAVSRTVGAQRSWTTGGDRDSTERWA